MIKAHNYIDEEIIYLQSKVDAVKKHTIAQDIVNRIILKTVVSSKLSSNVSLTLSCPPYWGTCLRTRPIIERYDGAFQ